MQSRYIFDKVNQDITASIAKQIEQNPPRASAPTNDDLACALIFIASIIVLIFI